MKSKDIKNAIGSMVKRASGTFVVNPNGRHLLNLSLRDVFESAGMKNGYNRFTEDRIIIPTEAVLLDNVHVIIDGSEIAEKYVQLDSGVLIGRDTAHEFGLQSRDYSILGDVRISDRVFSPGELFDGNRSKFTGCGNYWQRLFGRIKYFGKSY